MLNVLTFNCLERPNTVSYTSETKFHENASFIRKITVSKELHKQN